MYAQLGSREGSCQWSRGRFEVGDGAEDSLEYHHASGDAMAVSDGVVFGVGLVDAHENGGELVSVVGDFHNVVLGLAYEVWGVVGSVQAGGGQAALGLTLGRLPFLLRLSRRLGRSELVVEFLLEADDGPLRGGGLGLGDV